MAAPKQKPRGEIAELSTTLQSLCTAGKRSDKELRQQKRDVFKKVISYMTVGKNQLQNVCSTQLQHYVFVGALQAWTCPLSSPA
jgi:hypothetical protein